MVINLVLQKRRFAPIGVPISDNFGTNIFEIVATNLWNAVDLDYFAPSNCLVLSVHFPDGATNNFALLDTSRNLRGWSGLSNVHNPDGPIEMKIATAKATANGLTNGDLLFGNAQAGGIGWISANGTTANTSWGALTNEPDTVAGDLCMDETGIWGYDLLAVTGGNPPDSSTRGVWRIHPPTLTPTQICRIPAEHLEGVLTLPNDSRYGPWAATLVTGDEFTKQIYAVATNGTFQAYGPADGLDIRPDTFRLIPSTNYNLYCCCTVPGGEGLILKVSGQFFAPYVGDVLIMQSGEVSMSTI